MFIVFGVKRLYRVLATMSYVCVNCGQAAAHRIYSRWLFFSVFLLPVFPLGRKHHHSQCIGCGATVNLTREQAETIIGVPAGQELAPAQSRWNT
jgi:hypothetical protein